MADKQQKKMCWKSRDISLSIKATLNLEILKLLILLFFQNNVGGFFLIPYLWPHKTYKQNIFLVIDFATAELKSESSPAYVYMYGTVFYYSRKVLHEVLRMENLWKSKGQVAPNSSHFQLHTYPIPSHNTLLSYDSFLTYRL